MYEGVEVLHGSVLLCGSKPFVSLYARAYHGAFLLYKECLRSPNVLKAAGDNPVT